MKKLTILFFIAFCFFGLLNAEIISGTLCTECLANNCNYCHFNEQNGTSLTGNNESFSGDETSTGKICPNDFCTTKKTFSSSGGIVESNLGGSVPLSISFIGRASLTKSKDCNCVGNATTSVKGFAAGATFEDITLAGYSGYGLVGAEHAMQIKGSVYLFGGFGIWSKYYLHTLNCWNGCD